MNTYTLKYYQNRNIKLFETIADSLNDALLNLYNTSIEEDNTGIFFELANADLAYYKTHPEFYQIEVNNEPCGILLHSFDIDTSHKVMEIQTTIFNRFEVHSAPTADKYVLMVLDMAEEIIKTIPVEDLTQDVISQVETHNCHMACKAIDLIKSVDKYSMRQYTKNPHNI